MSLFERIREKRINLNEQTFSDRQKSDMKKLLNKNFGSKEISKKTADTQKQLAKDNKKMYDVTGKSAVRDAKKYASGEYPKIGGGTRIGPKSKGGGATTGGTKTVYQSDVSKQAKKYTKKINKRNINRPEGIIGDTYVSTDKKGNIRSAKKVNPTLKKTVSQVKGDIEFKQSLQKVRKFAGQKGTGELSDKAPQSVRDYAKGVRDKRIKDFPGGLPDTSFDAKTKFSQKGFESSLKDVKKAGKGFIGPRETKAQVNKRLGKVTNPFKGATGKATKGAATKLEFQPRDVSAKTYAAKVDTGLKKAKKSFKQLSSDIQDYRDRDVPGGPKKTKVTRTRVSYRTTPGGRESVGMASKFVNKYKKGTPQNPEISGIDFDKPKTNLKTVSGATGGGGGKKPPKVTYGAAPTPQGPREPRKITKKLKSNVSPTTQYRRTISKKYGIKPQNILSKTQKSILKQKRLAQRDVVKAAIGPQNRAFFKKAIALPGAKKAAPVIKALAKAGPVGRVAAAVGTVAALSPAARKGMSSFAKRALTGAGLGGLIGGAAASQKETDKTRIKNMQKPVFVKGSKKVEKGLNLNLSDISKPKDKPRTSQSIATEVEYLKKRQKVAPYGAKYTG